MSTFRVVVTDQVFPTVDIERRMLADIGAELEVAEGGPEEVREQAREADALLNTYLPIDAEFLANLERCKIIARYGIGVDNIDLDAARDAGIPVTNVPDYSVEEVAAHTLLLLLAALRRLPESMETVRQGEWGINRVRPIGRLSEMSVGLIGFGRIARRLAVHLRALGMQVSVFDPYLDEAAREHVEIDVSFVDDLDTLLAGADAVSVHCPLTPETRHIISTPQLERMPGHAVLVNTSRGPLVDLHALLTGLRNGAIRAAALDVVDPEPPPDAAKLAAEPNLLVTPHMAFYSEAALRESQEKATRQVIKGLRAEPLDYQVNPG